MLKLFGLSLVLSSLAAPAVATPVAATPSTLPGVWKQDDGSSTVRIAPCTGGRDLCATVIAEQLGPDQVTMLNRVAVKDIRPIGKQRFAGTFVDGNGSEMKAQIRQTDAARLRMKICVMGILCDTLKFSRLANTGN